MYQSYPPQSDGNARPCASLAHVPATAGFTRLMKSGSTYLGVFCLLVTSPGWGLNWPAMKLLLQECPPLFARGSAGLCASLLMAAFATFCGQSLSVPRDQYRRLVIAALFNVTIWMGFSTLSMQWLSAGQGAQLVYTMPIWAVLLAWPITGRRPSPASLLGLGLCIAGILILFGADNALLGMNKTLGVLFALSAAILFALATVAFRPPTLLPLANAVWQLGIGSLPMLAYGWLFESADLAKITAVGWSVFIYMTLVPMGICYIAWFYALKKLPPTTASISTLLTPIVGVLAGAAMLGEHIGINELSALALTLTGVACALIKRRSHPPANVPVHKP
ncbi:DMT family transporter [Pseudomonas sp. CG7]